MHTKRLVALGMTVAAMTSAGALAAGCGSSGPPGYPLSELP